VYFQLISVIFSSSFCAPILSVISSAQFTVKRNTISSTLCQPQHHTQFSQLNTCYMSCLRLWFTLFILLRTNVVTSSLTSWNTSVANGLLRVLTGSFVLLGDCLTLTMSIFSLWLQVVTLILKHGCLHCSTIWRPLLPHWYSCTAIKHPVPDRAKPSFVLFDIRALWRSGLSVIVSGCQKSQMTA